MLPYLDFLSVQFYNNPQCNLNSGAGYLAHLQAWSAALLAQPPPSSRIVKRTTSLSPAFPARSSTSRPGPRLLIGTPAFALAWSGYVDVPTYVAILRQVKSLSLAGAMFWDGAYVEVSRGVVGGLGGGRNVTFAEVVKDVLG
jgi:hypothetical protein